jgi:hypothetical protein
MKKFIALAGLVLLFVTAKAQFPTKDSLRSYININVRNSAVQSFTNLRLNTALNGIVNFLDSAGLGGSAAADTIYTINDSTARYKKGSNFYTFSLKGVYDSRRKVDSVYMLNDTMMNVVINGENRTVLIRGNGSGGGGTEALDATSMVRANSKLFSKNPVFTTLSSLRSVATADLNSGFIYRTNVNGVLGEWYYDGADASTADDTAMTLVTTGGKRLKRQVGKTIYPEWWGAVGDATSGISGTNDAPAFNAMFRWLERQGRGSYEIGFLHTDYYVSSAITLPYTLGTLAGVPNPYLFINGTGVTIKTDQAINIFYRMPASDADVGAMNGNYKLVMKGITLQGDRITSGQVGTRIACGYGWRFENIHYTGLDTAVVAAFMTKSTWTDCFWNVNQKVDIKLQSLEGLVGTQTIAGSASNDNTIQNVRFFEFAGAHAAVMLFGSDNTVIDHYIIEGAQPRYGIYADYQGSTVVNALYLNDGWFESNSASPSVNFRIKGAGLTRIRNIQRTYTDTLFDFDGSADAAQFEIDGLTYTGNLAAKPFSVGTSNPTFSGRTISFKNIDVATADLVVNATKWVGGSVPQNMSLEYFATANGGIVYKSTNAINFFPRASVGSIVDRYLYTESNFAFTTDNQGSIGGQYTTGSNRPKAVHVGETGVIVDTLGRVWWGRSAYFTPDVSIKRDSIGRLSILDGASTFADLKLRVGKFFGRSGYDTSYSLASMGDNDFITKQQATDLVASSAASIDFDPYWFTGTGVDPDFKSLDSTKFVTTYRGDTLHVRDSLLQDQINAFGRKVDTIYRVPGIDAIYYKIAGVEYSIKDSTGTGGGAGDNWGTQKVEHGGTLVRDGTLGSLLDVDTAVGKIASQYMIKTYTTTAGVGISVTVTTDADGNKTYQVTNTGSPGSNPMNALDIRSYGGTMDASVPASGSTPNGTDNTPFLQAAINAAADGQWVIVPPGAGSGVGYKFSTSLDTIKGPKRVYILFLADVYLANNDLIRIRNNSGDYEQHKIIFEGNIFGRVNQASHNKTTFDAGTGPVWSTYTNVVVKLIDVNQSYVQFNRVSGCKAPIEILTGLTTGSGAQENTVIGRRFTSCRYGILLTSFDGGSYCDKNYFGGPEGGTLRIGGNIPLMIDGFAATDYSGAFRSNEYHFLIENADSLPVANGDITENWFDITVEGGTSTGVLSSTATWHMKSSGTYYVRTPKYTWKGVYGAHRLGTGSSGSMGVDGTFKGSIWAQGSTAYYGNEGVIDGSGNIVIKAKESISNSTRNGAPSYVKFVNDPTYQPQDVVTITASSYTVASGVRVVKYNNASGTLTLPSPSTYPTRRISIININSGALAISGTLGSGAAAIILGNKSLTYFSDGSAWWAEGDGVGGALTFGTLHKVTDANVTVDDGDYIIEVYNQSATRTVTIPAASSYPNRVIWIVQRDGNGNTLNISQNWRGVDGALSGVLLNNNAVMLVSDGSEWRAVIERL